MPGNSTAPPAITGCLGQTRTVSGKNLFCNSPTARSAAPKAASGRYCERSCKVARHLCKHGGRLAHGAPARYNCVKFPIALGAHIDVPVPVHPSTTQMRTESSWEAGGGDQLTSTLTSITDRQRGLQGATRTGGGGKQGKQRHRREPQEDRKRG